jgi:hypothetical protein
VPAFGAISRMGQRAQPIKDKPRRHGTAEMRGTDAHVNRSGESGRASVMRSFSSRRDSVGESRRRWN